MSTYIYLECLAHDPPLRSPDEVGQHTYDLPRVRELIANKDVLVPAARLGFRSGDAFDRNAMQFLRVHSRCPLGLRDEYGRTYPVEMDS